jgi:hypothetical protein
MKIYKDKELKNEITTLDFGIVLAGETKQYEFYLLNDSEAILQSLSFKISHPEIKILETPKDLSRQETGKIVIEWAPTITLKAPLKAKLEIDGYELYR